MPAWTPRRASREAVEIVADVQELSLDEALKRLVQLAIPFRAGESGGQLGDSVLTVGNDQQTASHRREPMRAGTDLLAAARGFEENRVDALVSQRFL